MSMLIRVPRTFVPKEAKIIASKFRQEANNIRSLANQLRNVQRTLNSTWEGKSKNNFMAEFNSEPSNLESYARWLDDQARNIESMTVTVWETREQK